MKKVELKKEAAGLIEKGIYTIYSKWVKPQGNISNGEFIEVVFEDEVIGYGFYERIGAIGVRLIAYVRENPPTTLEEIISWRINKAFRERRVCGEKSESGYRLLYADADGTPGLIVDVFNETCVIQSTSYGWDKCINVLSAALTSQGVCERVYLKNDQRARKSYGMPIERKFIIGSGEPRTIIKEGKAKFIVDFEKGHKTGFYLDQRRARLKISEMNLNGFKVLDLFSYTGAFAVQALLAGADEAILVEENNFAVENAIENLKINEVCDKAYVIRGRVERFLDSIFFRKIKFNLVIADPPAFIPSIEYKERGFKAYMKLYENIVRVVEPGGFIYASSCSYHLSRDELLNILCRVAQNYGYNIKIIYELPATTATPYTRLVDDELRYLKGFLIEVY